MSEIYQSHLYFVNSLVSFIVMIELMINFKKPILLKSLILVFLTSIFIHNLSFLLNLNTFVREISRSMIILSGIHVIYLLYDFKLNKKLLALTLFSLFLIVFNFYTARFLDHNKHDGIFWLRRVIRIINSLGILTIFIIFYLKMIKSLDNKNLYSNKIKKWIKITIILVTVAILNNLSFILLPSISDIAKFISSFIHLTCCFLVIYRPPFINRTELSISLGKSFRKTIEHEVNSEEFIKEFFTSTYFVNKETSIDDFALKMKVTPKTLNDFIYETTKMNFTDLVNKNRVEFYVNMVSNKEFQQYSIEGLAELAGFGSRQSLYRNFKKYHGGSPSDLIRMYE